jgi:hypothetical protein
MVDRGEKVRRREVSNALARRLISQSAGDIIRIMIETLIMGLLIAALVLGARLVKSP